MKLQALLLPLLASLARTVDVDGQVRGRSLRPVERDEGVVKPLDYMQKLLICNAYPSSSPALVSMNNKKPVLDGEQTSGIGFGECRYSSTKVQQHDKLDFVIRDLGTEGTFEVGELPIGDAVLLLVLERRTAKSPLVSFKSFAFPTDSDGKDAKLAVIDTYKGNSSAPSLRMEDHMTGKEAKIVSKRVELLNFDHVYAIEEGAYDASVTDHAWDGERLAKETRKAFDLQRHQNYVILRTGDDDAHFPQSLVVFPNTPRAHSAAPRPARPAAFLAEACAAVALAAALAVAC